ncbi:hypothetical protein KUTeg_012829 [Tegillarca granosa]|uniref:Exonuclease domain-containing protein n=1 Tax=Tegillarca granosa TaxID=220873 RepID=A0ABQ9EWT7_TEGGR|nr:hypothetical protein KUTeg_012829 [Tegillarca granosa]
MKVHRCCGLVRTVWKGNGLQTNFEATCEDRQEIVPQLTGILQELVDGKKHLDEVLQDFKEWMKENKLDEEENSFIFVTCGYQVNAFSKNTAVYPKGMMPMLRYLNLPHIGRHHSGIDDCTNIANIVKELIKRGHIFTATGQL